MYVSSQTPKKRILLVALKNYITISLYRLYNILSEILNRPFPNFKIMSTPKILWNLILPEEFFALKNVLLWRCLMTRMAFSTLNIYPKFYQVLHQPNIRKHFCKPKIIPSLYATFKPRFIFDLMIVSYYFTTSMASSWLVALSAFWTNYSFSKISPFTNDLKNSLFTSLLVFLFIFSSFLFALLHTLTKN